MFVYFIHSGRFRGHSDTEKLIMQIYTLNSTLYGGKLENAIMSIAAYRISPTSGSTDQTVIFVVIHICLFPAVSE